MDWAHFAADYQPIHVGGNAIAKLFGLPGQIVHGQLSSYSLAHATFEAREGKGQGQGSIGAAAGIWLGDKPWKASFAFKRPMPYPARYEASFGRTKQDGPIHFALLKKGKEHLAGSVQRL